MAMQMMKRCMARMLNQSIVNLCRTSLGTDGYMEIDGTVCIRFGEKEETEEIVVKMHEIFGDKDDLLFNKRLTIPQPPRPGKQSEGETNPRQPLQSSQNQSVANSQQDNKAVYSQSPSEHVQGHHRSKHRLGQRTHPQADAYTRQASAPSEALQEDGKKMAALVDDSIIKTEIESDDETVSREQFKCGVCGNITYTHKLMADHLRSNHEFQGRYSCMLCNEYFPNRPTFTIHRMLSHPAAKDVLCQNCAVGLKNHESENHRKECKEDKTQALLSQKQRKKIKEQTENSELPEKRLCTTPSEALGNDQGKSDKRANRGEWFTCGVCGNTSDAHKVMLDHFRSGHKYQCFYTCMLCPVYYPNKSTFTIHRKLSHPAAKDVFCQNCGVGLKNSEYENHRNECAIDDALAVPPQKKDRKMKGEGHVSGPPAKRQCTTTSQASGASGAKKGTIDYMAMYPQSRGKHGLGRQSLRPAYTYKYKASTDNRADSGEQFECGVCGNMSDAHKVMLDHFRSDHVFQCLYTCILCSKYFPSKPTFTIHRKLSHLEIKDVLCQNCGVGLKNSEFGNHKKECGGDKAPAVPSKKRGKKMKEEAKNALPVKRRCTTHSENWGDNDGNSISGEWFTCGVCGNTSEAHKVMVEHFRSGHVFQGYYTCMLCNEYFPNKPTFTIHCKLSHPTVKDVFCQNCGAGPKNSRNENHSKECGEDIALATGLNKKNKKMEGEAENYLRPPKRQCTTPSQSSGASNKGDKKGSNTHNKRHFQICCLLLDSFPAYGKHAKNVHQQHMCPICASTFHTSHALQQHTARHTTNLPFTCDKCGLGSHTEDEFKNHDMVSHNVQPGLFTCAQCDVPIGSKREYLSHMADVHKVDYLRDEELEKHIVVERQGEDGEGDGFGTKAIRSNTKELPKKTAARQSPTVTTSSSPAVPRSHTPNNRCSFHEKPEVFICGVCLLLADSKIEIVDHLKSSHEFVSCLTCMICCEFFPNKPCFTIHRTLAHREAKERTCDSCKVGLYTHEFDNHVHECVRGGIDFSI